jgi:hypothetical protein
VENYIKEYSAMNLKQAKLVTRAHRPYRIVSGTPESSLHVKGAASDDSFVLSDIPISACLRALQSLAPSPTMQTISSHTIYISATKLRFWVGDMRPNTAT